MNDEAGWLIEMKFGDGLLWWSGEFDRAGDDYQRARLIARMVNDAGKAVRFARREDAQRVLDGMFSARPCPIFGNAPTLYSVQEHMWPAPSQPGQQPPQPINMVLHCPKCGEQHIDKADAWWNNPPHRSHLCHGCGHIWRPADVPTNGVAAIKTHGTNDSAIAQPPQAEQAAQPVAQEPRVCWLVEEFSDSGNSTGRYMLDQNGLTITTDAQQARRFLGSRTATFRATDMREKWGTSWRPVSHVFRAAQPQQAAQPVAPVGWLYDWTHSSATGRPDERFTSFTADEVYAFKGMGHENVRPVYAAAQPQQATEGSRLSDLRGLLADAQPKQPNGQA